MKNYSQNDEQEVILKYFGDFKGRFLDIGAYNGPDISNTWALLELGWYGVFVEPNPFNLVDLIRNVEPYADRAEVVCAGMGRTRIAPFYLDTTPGRGWAASCHLSPGIIARSPVKVSVPIITRIYARGSVAGTFEMVSVDAEYNDMEILSGLDLSECRLIVVEAVMRDSMKKSLLDLGFKIHHETPENIIAVK